MKQLGRFLLRGVGAVIAVLCLMWVFGPYEDAPLSARFDEAKFDQGVGAYLAWREGQVVGITEGVEKQVIWHNAPETQTEWAVVNIHGFSATAQEIRPVPDDVAAALGANLVFTRLEGHGLDGDALAQATVADWIEDTAEAIAIGRKVGRKVILIGTSTGATLAAAAALDHEMADGVAGMVMIAPNFAVNNPMADLLTWPAARYWLPRVAGTHRSFEPHNEGQARYFTTAYPSVAVMPMAALVKEVASSNFGTALTPALFIVLDEDRVVDPIVTREIIAQWAGPTSMWQPELTDADDPFAHVIAGDIMSPAQTDAAVAEIANWIGTLE